MIKLSWAVPFIYIYIFHDKELMQSRVLSPKSIKPNSEQINSEILIVFPFKYLISQQNTDSYLLVAYKLSLPHWLAMVCR